MNGIPLTDEQQLELVGSSTAASTPGAPLMAPALLRRLGLGRQRPVPVGQAGRLAPRRDPRPDGVSGRRRIKDRGGLRRSSPTCIDIGPTILEAAGIPQPRSSTASSRSRCTARAFVYTFDDADAAGAHTQQYFEILGNRGMYKDGWWAVEDDARIPGTSRRDAERFAPGRLTRTTTRWELYYLPDDFTQAKDLAAQHPEKLAELQELFWEEAERYKVLPLLGGYSGFFGILPPMPSAPVPLPRRAERRPGDDPADLRALLRDQRRPRGPRRAPRA